MFTVKRAAELTGLTPDTVRAWERRYGVVAPTRSPGGYRLYDDAALRRLAAMKELVDSGWSVRSAAERVLDGEPRDAWSATGAAPELDSLAGAARDFDPDALTVALDRAFASGPFDRVVDTWLMPSLEQVGNAWGAGEVTVAGEHFVSAAVQGRLAAMLEQLGPGEGTPVLVGLSRGSRHELGVLAFAVAARTEGLAVLYVGGDLPPEAWAAAVQTREARAAVIGVPSAEDVLAVRETVDALHRAAPDLPVLVGGGYQKAVGGATQPLGHRIGEAAAALADAVG
jgi:MerR family transcriptional regulator, light-induced transcriptional regulator